MLKLFIHEDAEADLEALWVTSSKAAAAIAVFLEELKGDQDLLDRVTQDDFGKWPTAERFHVEMWKEQQYRRGRNLWRLKLWQIERQGIQYRIIYAFVPSTKHHYVLGIMPREKRDFDYDENDPRTQRILRAYENL